jgi:hypothetical protein
VLPRRAGVNPSRLHARCVFFFCHFADSSRLTRAVPAVCHFSWRFSRYGWDGMAAAPGNGDPVRCVGRLLMRVRQPRWALFAWALFTEVH